MTPHPIVLGARLVLVGKLTFPPLRVVLCLFFSAPHDSIECVLSKFLLITDGKHMEALTSRRRSDTVC